MKTERTKFTIRISSRYLDWLRLESRKNGASINSEIVRAVQERIERLQAQKAGG